MEIKRPFTIFGNVTVQIDQALVDLYEANAAPFTDSRAEYLAVTSNGTKDMDVATLSGIIEQAIREEVEVYQDKEVIFAKAYRKGIFYGEKEHRIS